MSGKHETPSTMDESPRLANALDRALEHADEPTTMTGHALTELSDLIFLARQVEASAYAVEPSAAFRAAARARLVASMRETGVLWAAQARPDPGQPGRLGLALSGWVARVAAALSAVALAGAATASASASALPGDPLYAIKQVAEQVTLNTAMDDAVRQQIVLRQAETRLDETSRLLEQGRAADAGQNAARYGEAVEAAAGAVDGSAPIETSLRADRARLTTLLAQAPPPARLGLQRALEATERGLARVQRRAPQPEMNLPPRQVSPAVVQQAGDARPEATLATTTTTVQTAAGLEVESEAAQRERAEPSRHDAPPATVEDERGTGSASRPVGPPEHPVPPGPVVEKARGAPVAPGPPARRGRP